jgi:hypothetical protein
MLDAIQREAFSYFAHETDRTNGLVPDTTSGAAPASIVAVGLGLTACAAGLRAAGFTGGWLGRFGSG